MGPGQDRTRNPSCYCTGLTYGIGHLIACDSLKLVPLLSIVDTDPVLGLNPALRDNL